MWKFVELDAYESISLHDCCAGSVRIDGQDLIVDFPDGFWITPASKYIDHHTSLKTGPSQLRFLGLDRESVIDQVHIFKTTYLFSKPVLCRRITLKTQEFLKLVNDGKHQLEFLYEYHRSPNRLYQCWFRIYNHGGPVDCQLELIAKAVEYRWNEIRMDREW